MPTYTNVRTSVCCSIDALVNSLSSTARNAVTSHCAGLKTGLAVRKIGSSVPKATDSTT